MCVINPFRTNAGASRISGKGVICIKVCVCVCVCVWWRGAGGGGVRFADFILIIP